jgi:hypothetical protein
MIGNRRLLFGALMAALAFGALAAQEVSASPLTVEGISSGATAYMSMEQVGGATIYSSGGGNVSCWQEWGPASTTVGSGGTVNEITGTLATPTEIAGGSSNCTAFGFANAHVRSNECTRTLTTGTSVEAGKVTWSGSTQVHLLCPTGKEIEITPTAFGVSVCTQFVPPQTPTSGHVVGKSVAGSSPMDVALEFTLTGIHYTGVGMAGTCGNSETHSDGALSGTSTVRCFSDAAHVKQVGCAFS